MTCVIFFRFWVFALLRRQMRSAYYNQAKLLKKVSYQASSEEHVSLRVSHVANSVFAFKLTFIFLMSIGKVARCLIILTIYF